MSQRTQKTGNLRENFGGADRDRTDDLLNAIQALSQLSYGPTYNLHDAKKILESQTAALGLSLNC